MEESASIDWFAKRPSVPPFKRSLPITLWDVHHMGPESTRDRKLRMLRQLHLTCRACTMCDLGRQEAIKDYTTRDPHVLSNLNPQSYFIVGQNPGWGELEKGEPFVGAAGKNFDEAVAANGRSRDDFYITNMVKCWTKDNAKPLDRHCTACQPFLKMEINLIRPKLIISLGAVAFNMLCVGHNFSNSLKKITNTTFGPVFAVYHPSPRNLSNTQRRTMFNSQIRVLCKLMNALDENK